MSHKCSTSFLKSLTHPAPLRNRREKEEFNLCSPFYVPGLFWVFEPTALSEQTKLFTLGPERACFEDNLSEALLVLQSDCGLALSPLLEVDAVIRLNLTVDQWSNPDCRLHINPTVPVRL